MEILIDKRAVPCTGGESVLQAARRAGIYIPALCAHPDLKPQGDCGLCLVEASCAGQPVRACATLVSDGLSVLTDTSSVQRERRENLKKILKYHPHACLTCAQAAGCSRTQCSSNVPPEERCCELFGVCELGRVAEYIGIPPDTPRFVPAGLAQVKEPLFLRRPELCVGCQRCVRACRDLRGIEALTSLAWAGVQRCVPVEETLADSGCRLCTTCVEVCPTGALVDIGLFGRRPEDMVPCRAACPAGVDVPRYVRALAGGEPDGALTVLREVLPLPGVLSRVCFHPCEDKCRRGLVNEPISICRLKRAAVEYGGRVELPAPFEKTLRRVAVVGSGPAGLAAADALAGLGHEVTIFEAHSGPGGMLRWGIPAYRLPREVLQQEIDAVLSRGVLLKTGTLVSDARSLLSEYDAVFLATGAQASQDLGIKGESLDGVWPGLVFLHAVAAGEQVDVGDRVVVIGGGNTAVDCARTAVRLGARVTLVYRRTRREITALAEELAQAGDEGVSFLWQAGPVCFRGSRRVEAVDLLRYTMGEADESGRARPVPTAGSAFSLEASCVIVAVGQRPDPATAGYELGPGGLLRANADGTTEVRGLFAGGDVLTGPRSVVEAVAGGRNAARLIDLYLGGRGEIKAALAPVRKPDGFLERMENFWELKRPGITGRIYAPGTKSKCPAHEVLTARFAEVEWPLTEEMALDEAKRCLNCDLRGYLATVPAPPGGYMTLDRETVAGVPGVPGVYQLLDGEKNVVAIAGVPDLKAALDGVITGGGAARYLLWEENPMYTQRESQLIARFVEKNGRLPGGGGMDELDDLF